jgi:two-component system heavy metal sensor histidine kinase CusS
MISYIGINQILIIQQDRALTDRIERLEILLQDSENINQIIARPKLYQNMLGNQDNLFILMDHNQRLIDINPLNIPLPKLATSSSIQFTDLTQTEHPTRLSWKTINIHQKPYLLIAGKQWSERLNILEPFRNGLMVSVSIRVVLIFILSALASHFGLSTLRKLQQQTQAINVHQLQQRIQLDQAPSEIEQLTADINTMLNRIEIGYQQLNRFSEDIAHEFRTPLNNLIGQRKSCSWVSVQMSNIKNCCIQI